MKKSIKTIVSIVVAVVILIAAVVIALGFIRVKPIDKYFGNYRNVEIYDFSQSERIPEIENKNFKERLDDAIDGTSFSVLNAIVSGKADFSVSANQKDGKPNTFTAQQVLSLAATDTHYMIKLFYDKKQTLAASDVKGVDEDITFDVLYMFVSEGADKVATVQVVPVDTDSLLSVSDDSADSEFYYAYDLRVNMYIVNLYKTVSEIIQDYKNL